MSKHQMTDKRVREMGGVPKTLKKRSVRAARKVRNGRQEMEGKKWRKARNGGRLEMEEG